MLVGVPGSGKSTWVNNQEWAKDCVYISTDALVEAEAVRQDKTYNDIFKDYMPTAVKLMSDQVVEARDHGKDIIWDQTSTTVNSRKKKFNMLRNYDVIAVVFKTPEPEELSKRLANRPGKHIPDHVIDQMISGWEDPTQDEGFMEIWYV